MTQVAEVRKLGSTWELNFCRLAVDCGHAVTPHQIGRDNGAACWYEGAPVNSYLLPDIVVWSAPGEHHEIKHKDATRWGNYGLEKYRLDALVAFAEVTGQPVLYTIHDWRLAGAESSAEDMPNRLCDWLTVDVRMLVEFADELVPMRTLYNGHYEDRLGFYWPTDLWVPLSEWWEAP